LLVDIHLPLLSSVVVAKYAYLLLFMYHIFVEIEHFPWVFWYWWLGDRKYAQSIKFLLPQLL